MTRDEMNDQLWTSTLGGFVAGALGVALGAGAVIMAFTLGMSSPFVFWGFIAAGGLVSTLSFLKMGEKESARAKAWTEFYANSTWATPAGEKVTIIDVDGSGEAATVRFADGYSAEFSLWLLHPLDGFEKVQPPSTRTESENLLFRVSLSHWKYLDGRIGAVRGARRVTIENASTDYITLGLADGTFEFERADLSQAETQPEEAARKLGFSMVFAGSDIAAMKRLNDKVFGTGPIEKIEIISRST